MLVGMAAQGASAQYTLLYDYTDGALIILSDGTLINYAIESTGGQFDGSAHQPILGGILASTPTELRESNPFAPIPAGDYNLGNVLPPLLHPIELFSIIAINDNSPKYVAGLGAPQTDFNVMGALTPPPFENTDYDTDIDDADLGTAFANYTGPVGEAGGKSWAQGNTDFDGDVDDADLGSMIARYTGPVDISAASVPEPAAGLVVLLGLGAVRRRRDN